MPVINKPGLPLLLEEAKKENAWLPHTPTVDSVQVSDMQELPGGRVTAVMSGHYGHGYSGKVDVTYGRIDLAKLFGGKPLEIGVLSVGDIYAQLAEISYITGVTLGPGDILNIPAPSSELPYDTVLKASSTSAVYYGEVPVRFVSRQQRLNEVIALDDYVTIRTAYDPTTVDRARGEHLTYGTDYTSVADQLKLISLGVFDAAGANTVASILTAVDELQWTGVDQEGFWSLFGAKCSYNGLVSEYVALDGFLWPNLRFTHVCIIDLIVDRGLGDLYGSKLFIHYNVLE